MADHEGALRSGGLLTAAFRDDVARGRELSPRGGTERRCLTEALRGQGVKLVRNNNVSFDLSNPIELARLDAVLEGPLLTVIVGGRAKANPQLDEVLAEVGRVR